MYADPFIIRYQDFAAGLTKSFGSALGRFLDNAKRNHLSNVVMEVITPFAGGTTSAATISIGKSGAATELMTAKDVMATAATIYTSTLAVVELIGVDLLATLVITGDTSNHLTAGKIAVWVQHKSLLAQS